MEISLLIVDDDKLLVEKLEETVAWRDIGISMVFTANNIRQAQQLLEKFPIQLLLCDIDMPQGSGLELLEWIRQEQLPVECVFLSSYANFAYAQKALQLSSREYLLKPIANDALEKALVRLVRSLDGKQAKESRTVDEQTEEFWKNFIFSHAAGEGLLSEGLKKGLYCAQDQICLMIIKIFRSVTADEYKKELSRVNYMIHPMTTEFLKRKQQNLEAVVHLGDYERLFIFNMKKDIEDLKKCTAELINRYDQMLPDSVCIYLGQPRGFLETVTSQEKLEYMAKHGVLGETAVICEEDWSFEAQEYVQPPWDAWLKDMNAEALLTPIARRICDYIRQRKHAEGSTLMRAQVTNSRSQRALWTKETLARFVRELIQLLYRYLNDREIRFSQLFEGETFEYLERQAYQTLAGAEKFVQYVFEQLEGNRRSDNRGDNVVEQLKIYIEENLREDLSRRILAKKVFLSEVYISKLFAGITGMSIPAYIAARRVEKAKEYLRHSNLTVSKIALEVGYSNFSYFSKTFRDLVGCTPNEYRNQTNKNI